ncbi:hypothetical protein TNCV_1110541 [Trichonephila clavipes]|nr:hypothetical protein TNCV_1110541 [Trichonephila clavipes]
MYKNALKEDFIRVVEKLDGTVESTDTIVKLKTKIENSSTFESDPDFAKSNAVFARRRIEMKLKQKPLGIRADIRAEKERSSEGERKENARGARAGVTFPENDRQSYL